MECHKLLLPLLLISSLLCLSVKGQSFLKKKYIRPKMDCPLGVITYYEHPTDCTKFFQCSNGVPIEQDCGPGTVFNLNLKVCVTKGSNWDTCSEKFPPPLVNCKPGDHYLAHPKDCSKFFQCSNGAPVEQVCATGSVFSEEFDTCVGKNSYYDECSPPLCNPGFSSYYQNFKDCSKFFQCDNGVLKSHDCPSGTVFSDTLDVCVQKNTRYDTCNGRRKRKFLKFKFFLSSRGLGDQ